MARVGCSLCWTETQCKAHGFCLRHNAQQKAADARASEPTILDEAKALVHGDRQDSYGHPADDFARTAALWHAEFGWDVKPEDVAVAMALVKLSRLRASPGHRDSVVDWAGYADAYWLARRGA